MKKIDKNGFLIDFVETRKKYLRRQDLPTVYSLNGAIYISKTIYFLRYKNFFSSRCLAFIMDELTSVDIDTIYDFEYAEFLITSSTKI